MDWRRRSRKEKERERSPSSASSSSLLSSSSASSSSSSASSGHSLDRTGNGEDGNEEKEGVVVVNHKYCKEDQVQLFLVKRTLDIVHKDTDFAVADNEGTLLFTIYAESLRSRKTLILRDLAGNNVLSVHRKMFSLRKRWNMYKGTRLENKNKILTIRKSQPHTTSRFESPSLHAFSESKTKKKKGKKEKHPNIEIVGSPEIACLISHCSETIAEVTKEYVTLVDSTLHDQSFSIKVKPSIDYSLIVMLVVVIIEVENEENENSVRACIMRVIDRCWTKLRKRGKQIHYDDKIKI